MSKLSVEKLNSFKRAKNLTNKKISELTEISIATIDRLFSGANTNPNINLLKKLSTVFECTVDDFMDYDKNSPLANCYENKEAIKLAQEIQENSDYKKLFNIVRNLKSEDLQAVIDIAGRIKE